MEEIDAAPAIGSVRLVVFDCDGVLVDSESITNRVFTAMLQELGLAVSPEDVYRTFVGHTMPQCMAMLAEKLGRNPPADFLAQFDRRMFAALQSELRPMPDLAYVLDDLDGRGIPYCVASNGSHAKMALTLGLTGLAARFEGKRFSAEDVKQGKPAPDLFLHAAHRFGVDPAHCLVIEDSASGVKGGVMAGMRVYGYAAATSAESLRQAGAHSLFTAMRALPAMIP